MIRRLLSVAVAGAFLVPAYGMARPLDTPASEQPKPAPTVELLPMPREEPEMTCPYLRQQSIDRQASRFADPDMSRDVLANLQSLKDADNLVDVAKILTRDGFFAEAMMCCDLAAKLCPGSPCAARAVEIRDELAQSITPTTTDTEESAEPEADEPTGPCSQGDVFWRQLFASMGLPVKENTAALEPGVEPMVADLMKACHLLMSQGMQHQAAELARQAYALDPQRVMADPLIYKMHLLTASPGTTPAGSSEESEPQTCPYFPSKGTPIHGIVPEKKQNKVGPTTFLVPALPAIDYEVVPVLDNLLTESQGAEEASEPKAPERLREMMETMLGSSLFSPIEVGTSAGGGLRVFGECSLGSNVYHLRYKEGSLVIWKSMDASWSRP